MELANTVGLVEGVLLAVATASWLGLAGVRDGVEGGGGFHLGDGGGQRRVCVQALLLHGDRDGLNELGGARVEGGQHALQVRHQAVREGVAEILAHHDAEERDVVRVGRHGVGRHGPAVAAEPVGDFVLVVVGAVEQGERHHGHALLLGQDLEAADSLDRLREELGILRAAGHDTLVALEPQTDELVVLRDHLACAFGEV